MWSALEPAAHLIGLFSTRDGEMTQVKEAPCRNKARTAAGADRGAGQHCEWRVTGARHLLLMQAANVEACAINVFSPT
jgi:hypothetical protein